jgi:GABA permease
MWLFPYLTYATILAVTIIYAAQAFISDMQSQFYMTSILTAVIIGAYFVFYRKKESVSVNLADVKLTEMNPE